MRKLSFGIFLVAISFFQISFAQESGSVGAAFANIANKMVNPTYLQLYGSVGGSSASNYFSGGGGTTYCPANQTYLKTCQLGASGPTCNRVAPSVISGSVECWSGNNFSLYTASGTLKTQSVYSVVSRLQGATTDDPYYLAQPSFAKYPVVVDASGKVLADGNMLGCKKFVATSSQTLSCFSPDGKQSNLNINDLKNINKGSVYVKDIAQNIDVDLCGVTLGQGKSDSYFSNYRQFKLQSQTTVQVKKVNGSVGAVCEMSPHNDQPCTKILLGASGMQCYYGGAVKYTVPLNMSPSDMTAVAKKYLFDNKEIVTMAQVNDLSENAKDNVNPEIKIVNPLGYITTPRISSASGSSGNSQGASGGQ